MTSRAVVLDHLDLDLQLHLDLGLENFEVFLYKQLFLYFWTQVFLCSYSSVFLFSFPRNFENFSILYLIISYFFNFRIFKRHSSTDGTPRKELYVNFQWPLKGIKISTRTEEWRRDSEVFFFPPNFLQYRTTVIHPQKPISFTR